MNQSKIYYSIPTFLNIVIIFFSITTNILWYFPALKKLQKLNLMHSYISILLFIFFIICIIAVGSMVGHLTSNSIKKQMAKQRRAAVNEFVYFLYENEDFKNTVLHRDIDLYDSNHEKCGHTIVWSKLTEEQSKFINAISHE